jgi:hypothetical protein
VENATLDRLLAIAKRDLEARDIWIEDEDDARTRTTRDAIEAELPDGRRIVAELAAECTDREARLRRLDMLVETFRELLDPARPITGSRPPPAQSLHEALDILATRAAAVDALVIDARSPLVWASSGEQPRAEAARGPVPNNVVELHPQHDRKSSPPPAPPTSETMRATTASKPDDAREDRIERAIAAVRGLPETMQLHKGAHLHRAERGDEFGWLARSFASIYALVLVFDQAFDELRAERAVAQSLPIIERLVTALPPIDPTPTARSAALRRPR